jgi:hypothetical protein
MNIGFKVSPAPRFLMLVLVPLHCLSLVPLQKNMATNGDKADIRLPFAAGWLW